MPWNKTEPMNEKVKFVSAYLNNNYGTFQSLCDRFHISRKTGYKIINRFKQHGPEGLIDRSRAPKKHGRRMPEYIEHSILELKDKYPKWGAKKIYNWLLQERPTEPWPAKSTIDELFKRHGLVRPAKRKKRVAPYTEPFVLCTEPNDSWSIDYKGQFKLLNGQMCYPLTVTDNFSRYILAIDGSTKIATKSVKSVLEALFFEFGLPKSIKSDNGSPFAGNGLGGLSRLSVWLIKNGVIPERIKPGRPQENGRHERMHLVLKEETTKPPQDNMHKQQALFNQFINMFNEERPHEGIDFKRPSHLYEPSERTYYGKPKKVEYDESFMHKRAIRTNGTMKWNSKELFISETLVGETIGMKPHSEDEWLIFFSSMPIGVFKSLSRILCK